MMFHTLRTDIIIIIIIIGTYPGHDPEAGVRLLDEGERVEGSTGSARAERADALLHPVHQPRAPAAARAPDETLANQH